MTDRAERPPRAADIARGALGLGLRPPLYRAILEQRPDIDYFEIIADNFIGEAEQPLRWLARIREHYPIVVHAIGLNLLGADPLDEAYVDGVRKLADRLDAPFVSDHLCWSAFEGLHHHDLLPTPYTEDLVDYAAARAAWVQDRLGRPLGLENLSSYVQFKRSTMTEWDFYTKVVEASGTWFMLDINNVFVSSQNHGFDPSTYLQSVDSSRVLQIHLAGHEVLPNGGIIDTHDHPVVESVWRLYGEFVRRGGLAPTMLEWDDAIPPLATLLSELERAKQVRA